GWDAVFAKLVVRRDPDLIQEALLLGLDFGDPNAIGVLRKTAMDPRAPAEQRSRVLASLVERRVPNLVTDLQSLTGDQTLRGLALRLLAAYDDPATPETVLRYYTDYSPEEREDAIATLAARPAWAKALLGAMARGVIPRRDMSVSIARQLQAF